MPAHTVAQTILHQLGGGRFIAMTGASHFAGDATMLQFSFPSAGTRNKANKCRVTLDPDDTYTLAFFHIGRLAACTERGTESGVYAEDLQRLFTAATGLNTHL